MCEPVTLSTVGMLVAGPPGASIGLGVGTALEGGDMQAEALRAQRDAELAAAASVEQRGAQEAGRKRVESSREVGSAQVAMAAGGVETGSGSALDLLADTRMMGELDALTLRNNAQREAWGHRVSATAYEAAARNAKRQARLGAAATFLSGVTGTAVTAASLAPRKG